MNRRSIEILMNEYNLWYWNNTKEKHEHTPSNDTLGLSSSNSDSNDVGTPGPEPNK